MVLNLSDICHQPLAIVCMSDSQLNSLDQAVFIDPDNLFMKS